ncbi:hypothetical protein OB955_11115 [Halobacteria archaeon AArc-m2/3/4]|uniref:Uncharacterized protein n=1 Tax=Natronoglomus mannanivorans TaxID=2979990 RepID=A0AAP2YY76_9EURY|nr:hypothetical protein [Halobacteria archaeon AArc-xg1-1]MCU4973292.1 hypothetical protein [Halobacteria archaeon AArc-m2/3/4]
MAGYYDIVLGLIPVALVGITAALTVVGISLTTAVPFGAIIAIGLIGHAMFVNAPVDGREDTRTQRPPLNAD